MSDGQRLAEALMALQTSQRLEAIKRRGERIETWTHDDNAAMDFAIAACVESMDRSLETFRPEHKK